MTTRKLLFSALLCRGIFQATAGALCAQILGLDEHLLIKELRLLELPTLCQIVLCPDPDPNGPVEKPGLSLFLPFDEIQRFHQVGSDHFGPGDWRLRLREKANAPAEPSSPLPLPLKVFEETPIESGNGVIGDELGEGVALFFPIDPEIWAHLETVDRDLVLSVTNLTTDTDREDFYSIGGGGRGRVPPIRFCDNEDGDPRLTLIVQDEPSIVSPSLFENETDRLRFVAPPGVVGHGTFYVAIVSTLPVSVEAIGGWVLSISVTGDLEVVSAAAHGLDGFVFSDSSPYVFPTDPDFPHSDTGLPQGEGVVNAATLQVGEFLPPVGTTTVLEVTVATKGNLPMADVVTGEIQFRGGLRATFPDGRVSQPYDNYTSVYNSDLDDWFSREFCETRGARILFEPGVIFSRGDASDDGRFDMTDALELFRFLFLGNVELTCLKAADVDGNSDLDLTDGLLTLKFLFLGGNPPPPPFGQCAEEPEGQETKLSCERSSACE